MCNFAIPFGTKYGLETQKSTWPLWLVSLRFIARAGLSQSGLPCIAG